MKSYSTKVLGLSKNALRVFNIIQESGARDVVTINYLADEVELDDEDVGFCLMALERRGLININGSQVELN